MGGIIYAIVITVFCVLMIVFFVVREKREKKRQNELLSQLEKKEESSGNGMNDEGEEVEEPKVEAIFEDFKISQEIKDEGSAKRGQKTKREDFLFDEDDEFSEYEKFLRRNMELDEEERRFNEESGRSNEKLSDDFVPRRVPNLDDHFRRKINSKYDRLDRNFMSEEDEALDAVSKFDFNSIKGKSQEEIAEMIKNLPPKAQEILMSDILARRDFFDEQNDE